MERQIQSNKSFIFYKAVLIQSVSFICFRILFDEVILSAREGRIENSTCAQFLTALTGLFSVWLREMAESIAFVFDHSPNICDIRGDAGVCP